MAGPDELIAFPATFPLAGHRARRREQLGALLARWARRGRS